MRHENVVNVKELQKSPSRSLRGLTRILRGSKTLGYFLDSTIFEDFVEDLEAAASPNYKKRVATARKETGGASLEDLNARYGV